MILQNTDQHTRLQIKLSESSFTSGKKLTGVIVVHANIDRSYTSLSLKLECVEELVKKQKQLFDFMKAKRSVQHTQNSHFFKETEEGDQSHHQSSAKIKRAVNYQQRVVINNFDEFLPRGQHFFPFSLILPKGLPGSLYLQNSQLYAKTSYELTASLSQNKKQNKTVETTQLVHINQFGDKFRYVEKTLYQKNCFCFLGGDDDSIRVHYQINNQFLTPGTQFNLIGKIDTRDTSEDVQGVELVLVRKIMVREKVRVMVKENREWMLWRGFRKLSKGLSTPLHITVNVPQDIEYPSAQGEFIGVFYHLMMRIDCKNLFGSNEVGTQICLHTVNPKQTQQSRSENSIKSIKKNQEIKLDPYPEQKKISYSFSKYLKQPL